MNNKLVPSRKGYKYFNITLFDFQHPAKVIQVDREKGTFRVHYMGWRASYDRDFSFSTKDVVFFHKPARPLNQPRYEVEAQVIAVYRK
jgi:hypothetical protein